MTLGRSLPPSQRTGREDTWGLAWCNLSMLWFCNWGIFMLGFYDSKGLWLFRFKQRIRNQDMSSSGSGSSAEHELGSPAGRMCSRHSWKGFLLEIGTWMSEKIGIPAQLSPRPQPGGLECSFCCFRIFLSFCPLWVFTNPPKDLQLQGEILLMRWVCFWLAGVGAHPKWKH